MGKKGTIVDINAQTAVYVRFKNTVAFVDDNITRMKGASRQLSEIDDFEMDADTKERKDEVIAATTKACESLTAIMTSCKEVLNKTISRSQELQKRVNNQLEQLAEKRSSVAKV